MASGTLNNGQNGSPWANKNRQSTYGQGLGGIQAWGHANPLGPYAGLQNNTPGAGGSGSGSSTTAPVASGADKWLEDVLAGKNLPFSPEQQAAQLTQQSDMSAAAEGARNEQAGAAASAGGSSGRDPSLQGAKMNSLARRQTDNQQAAGNIAAQAGQVNFGAQMNAANTLSGNSMTREGWNQQNKQSASNSAQSFLPWNQPASGGSGKQSYINFSGFQPGGNATGRGGAAAQPAWNPNQYANSGDATEQRYAQEDADWNNRTGAYKGMTQRNPDQSAPYRPTNRRPASTASDGYYELE